MGFPQIRTVDVISYIDKEWWFHWIKLIISFNKYNKSQIILKNNDISQIS